MYKLTNNKSYVLSTITSMFISIDHKEYKQWLLEGNTPEPEFTDAELLANAKTAKLQELEIAFITTSKLPVTVGAKTYNGGKESALAIRDYIQLVTESGGTSFTIWDSSNAISTYTLTEATAIKLAVATAVAQGEVNLRMKKNAVNDATTITAVNAVTY